MGILDDAIREHLDLKRRQGANQEELARLEDEAFGPPSRPGDPDFAEGAQESGPNGERALDESVGVTATELPDFHDEEADEREAGGADVDLEAGLDLSEEGPSTAEGSTVVPGEPTVEHDTLSEGEEPGSLDLDIDLDIEEEIEDVSDLDLDEDEGGEDTDTGGDQPSGGEATSAADEPIESLDTVEHHFEDAIDEAEVVEDDSEELSIDSDDEEDVLEETPEFLRDAPEDDELWFEQGEPKDFDF